jgi:hypothetical protein
MFTSIKLFFASFVEATTTKTPTLTRNQREVERYLSQSVDRCDFERREKHLERNGFFL